MDKKSSYGVTCSKCDLEAVPGTNPPLCEKHLQERKEQLDKEAGYERPRTLKELLDEP